jgi:hypothetical protein
MFFGHVLELSWPNPFFFDAPKFFFNRLESVFVQIFLGQYLGFRFIPET